MLIDDWHRVCYDLAKKPKLLTSGSRKILRGITWSVPILDNSVDLSHMGYSVESGMKIAQLKRYYLNQESVDSAIPDYLTRVKKKSYGSVGVTTHGAKKGHATQQGQCIQAFTMTNIPKTGTEIDIFYRTTEIMKKFGADLVFFRDEILPQFNECFEYAPINAINFHFANVSVHPMFFCLLSISDPDFIDEMEEIRKIDPYFFNQVRVWTLRNMEGRLDQKFLTSRRVGRAMWEELGGKKFRKLLRQVRKM